MATVILAGCGGSGQPKAQVVSGDGFSFQAPAGWKVTRAPGRAEAAQGAQLVQVASFRLLRPYRDALFAKVAGELDVRMRQIVAETGGTLAGSRTVVTAGIRSHSYTVDAGSHVDEYTFVLQDSREYQLLCRRASSGSSAVCEQLVRTFATA